VLANPEPAAAAANAATTTNRRADFFQTTVMTIHALVLPGWLMSQAQPATQATALPKRVEGIKSIARTNPWS